MVGVKYRREHVGWLEAQPGELLVNCARYSCRSLPQAITLRIFANCEQYFPDGALDPGEIEVSDAQWPSPSPGPS